MSDALYNLPEVAMWATCLDCTLQVMLHNAFWRMIGHIGVLVCAFRSYTFLLDASGWKITKIVFSDGVKD